MSEGGSSALNGSAPAPPPEYMFRAAPMMLVQMYITKIIARDVVGELGELGCVHFEDLNAEVSAFNRQFVPELRKIEGFVRNLRSLQRLAGHGPEWCASLDPDLLAEPLLPSAAVASIMESAHDTTERLSSLADSFTSLTIKRDELIEERSMLQHSQQFFGARYKSPPSNQTRKTDELPLLDGQSDGFDDDSVNEFEIESTEENASNPFSDQPSAESRFASPPFFNQDILAGVIDRTKTAALERLCWRITRGNVVFSKFRLQSNSKKDPVTNGIAEKDVFLVYTHGALIGQRVLRLCESLDARIVRINYATRTERMTVVNDQLNELFTVIDQTEGTLRVEQEMLATKLPLWQVVAAKERAVYETLNLFSSDHGRQGLIGEGWVPADSVSKLQNLLATISEETSQLAVINTVQTERAPPTYHTTNKVTAGFQAMVDIYGISRHGEVNPGLPTVVTFPFLFAVMFGDVGHGFILFLGAFALVWNERSISRQRDRNEILDMAFNGRYVLLFMGLFSIFTGFIYNDIFSRSMTIFSSGWEFAKLDADVEKAAQVATRVGRKVYPFGIDWAWHAAENNLRFTNSYKMKLSILLGFVHMTYSLTFQLVNARHFKSWIDVWGNFVPSMLFMQSIFGYLSLTIVYKWCVDWFGKNREPPGLLDLLIKMFLSPGTIDPPLYSGQAVAQIILLLTALICVPWLLLFKPLYLRRQMKRSLGIHQPERLDEHTFAIDEDTGNEFEIYDPITNDDLGGSSNNQGTSVHASESFGDIMIHQVIHTIEFCLNCVSHTASYLRLWALSLAHSQLSIVLWNMTLRNAFGLTGAKGIVMSVILFGMWFVITVLVLVCMEGTSAMLHALRLQWVEAMSKHFEGEGYAFDPLDFHDISL